ncbi:MAG: hypothetical protein ABI822_22870 [Bryobacteraceae bacterium]
MSHRTADPPVRGRAPARPAQLLTLALLTATLSQAQTFRTTQPAEVIADLEISAPSFDWAVEGREAPIATVTLDKTSPQQIMLYAGAPKFHYKLFLGALQPGTHHLEITGAGFETHTTAFHEIPAADPYHAVLANAPVVFARKNTIGKFTDIPLTLYAERLTEDGHPLLQYTMIFSNEDGGTSTRALMARWGRTTDIEYLYKAFLNPDGTLAKATIQARDHKEIEFTGKRDGAHPLLIPVTDNNMVAGDEISSVRYQLAPVLVDLTKRSRESVMDDNPITYQVMFKELIREKKLRPFGTVDGEKISDPRNYLYVDYNATNTSGALAVHIKLKKDTRWYSSSLGRTDYAIARNGWVRTTVELPPGTKPGQIAEIGFECLVPAKEHSGTCRLEAVEKAFFLDGPPVFSLRTPIEIPTGQTVTFAP